MAKVELRVDPATKRINGGLLSYEARIPAQGGGYFLGRLVIASNNAITAESYAEGIDFKDEEDTHE